MMSLQMINELSRSAARRAARRGAIPLIIEAEDVRDDRVESMLRGIPNFGDYRPRGWRVVRRAALTLPEGWRRSRLDSLGCDDDYVFVDKSGFGAPDEPALTFGEFCELVSANPGLGWAFVEEGQFQIVVAAFRRFVQPT